MKRYIKSERILNPEIEKGIKNALIDYGAIGEDWKINITDVYPEQDKSDWYIVELDVTRPRHKKPSYGWKLRIHSVYDRIDFQNSEHFEY